MKRSLALLAVVGLFLLGMAAGVLATHLYYARQLQGPGGPPMMAGRFFSHRLERRLGLTPEQKGEIDAILERTRRQADALRGELRPRVRELMEEANEEIEQVLTPAQREAWDELRRDHRRRADQFLLGPPPHGPGHGPGPGPGPGPRPRRRPPPGDSSWQ